MMVTMLGQRLSIRQNANTNTQLCVQMHTDSLTPDQTHTRAHTRKRVGLEELIIVFDYAPTIRVAGLVGDCAMFVHIVGVLI